MYTKDDLLLAADKIIKQNCKCNYPGFMCSWHHELLKSKFYVSELTMPESTWKYLVSRNEDPHGT